MAKTLNGIVVSTRMDKTIVVKVQRKFRHPLYKKVIKVDKKFKVHNEIEGIQEGDEVVIAETRPISKHKHFRVVEKVS